MTQTPIKNNRTQANIDPTQRRVPIFTLPDGGARSITAGNKCAFANLIFAMDGKDWTSATKMLAVTYFDLSEKEGYAFATQEYLEFRTNLSRRTMNRANAVIENSGFFRLKYLPNNSLEIIPDLRAIEDGYSRYQAAHAAFIQERKDKWTAMEYGLNEERRSNEDDGGATNCREGSDKLSVGYRQNGAHNLSMESLPPNLSMRTIPGASHPGVAHRTLKKDRASGVDRHGRKKLAGGYQQSREEADQDWIELNRILPETSEDAEHQPREDSAKGAKVHWFQLLRSGIPSRRIVLAAQAYKDRKPVGQWVCGVAGFLTQHFDPEQLPDGTYPDDKQQAEVAPAAANDNDDLLPVQKASGDYG
ncbi:hypothetical protein V1291_001526 [Nitrobacteraceae bacterium AZCC 1564]